MNILTVPDGLVYLPSEDKVYLKKTVTDQPSPYVTTVNTLLFDANTGKPYYMPNTELDCKIVRLISIGGIISAETSDV